MRQLKYIFAGLFFLSFAEASVSCAILFNQNFEAFHSDRVSKIEIWRYAGQESFELASHLNLEKQGDFYYPQLVGIVGQDHRFYPRGNSLRFAFENYKLAGFIFEKSTGSGDNHLARNQHFSLDVMEKWKYIGAKIRKIQEGVIHQLRRDQVTFFELKERYSGTELITQFGQIPEHAKLDSISQATEKYFSQFAEIGPNKGAGERRRAKYQYDLKVAGCWLISGQSLEAQMPLPLENDKMLTALDRNKYPYVWEIGRAAQTTQNGFKQLFKMAVYTALQELIILGGNIEDAYILTHSLDEVHTKLYKRQYGGKYEGVELSGYQDNPEEKALIIPLTQLLMQMSVQDFSSGLAYFSEISGNKNVFEMMTAFLRSKQMKDFHLNAKPEDTYSVFIRDHSVIANLRIENMLKTQFGAQEIKRIQGLHAPEFEWRDFAYFRAQEIAKPYVNPIYIKGFDKNSSDANLNHFLRSHSAIEISLGGEIDNPFVILKQVYLYYMKVLSEMGISDPREWMKEHKIIFAFSTLNSDLASTLQLLPLTHQWEVKQNPLYGALRLFGSHSPLIKKGLFQGSYLIQASELDRFLKIGNELNELVLSPGNFHRARYLEDPNLFFAGL